MLRSLPSTPSVSGPSLSNETAFRLDFGADIPATSSDSRDSACTSTPAMILSNWNSPVADSRRRSENARGYTDDRYTPNRGELAVTIVPESAESRQEVSEASELRQQNEALRNQVAHLEIQMQIERELGLGAESPPEYTR